MIEQILYLNLDRRPDRNEWFLENMEAAGVPMELVERVPAKDWRDYDSVEDIVKAMQKDGFGKLFFESKHHHYFLGDERRGRAALIWTVSCALRKIVETDKVTLVLHDDCAVRSWNDLTSELNEAQQYFAGDKDLHVIQLSYDMWTNIFPNPCVRLSGTWNTGIHSIREDAVIYGYHGARFMLQLVQGGLGDLNTVEHCLYMHFNNQNSLHPVNNERFTVTMEEQKIVGNARDMTERR